MNICPKCNCTITNEQARFCPNCGARLDHSEQTQGTADTAGTAYDPKNETAGNYDKGTGGDNSDGITLGGETSNNAGASGQQGGSTGYQGGSTTGYQGAGTSGQYGQGGSTGYVQRPSTYIALAILSTILCCPPIGIYAIICSIRTEKENNLGNIETARKYSRKALYSSIVAAISGPLLTILVGVICYFFIDQYSPATTPADFFNGIDDTDYLDTVAVDEDYWDTGYVVEPVDSCADISDDYVYYEDELAE